MLESESFCMILLLAGLWIMYDTWSRCRGREKPRAKMPVSARKEREEWARKRVN